MNNTSDRKLAAIMFADTVSFSRLMGKIRVGDKITLK